MPNEVEIDIAGSSVINRLSHEIKSSVDTTEITTEKSKQVSVHPNNYVISTGGIYRQNNNPNDLPSWISDAIDNAIKDGNVSIDALLNDLTTYVANLENGVSQSIASIKDEQETLNSLVTTNKSSNDIALAAVSDSNTTKVTADEAETIALNAIATEFTGAGGVAAKSWYASINESQADEVAAHSSSLTTLSNVITHPNTGVTATSTAVDQIYSSTGMNPDGSLTGTAGHFYDLGVAIDGVSVALTTTNTVNIDGEDWTVGASKLGYNPTTGGITGWSFQDGSGLNSGFTIQADRFAVTSANGTHEPFSVDFNGGNPVSVFNGKVIFTSNGADTELTGDTISSIATSAVEVPTSTSGAANPTTTTEPLGSTYHNTADDSMWTYTSSGWVAGGNPDALVAADLGPTGTTVIDGGRIDTDSLFARDITFSGVMTGGGASGVNGIIKSSNYVDGVSGMKIDLVSGSIYIA